MNKLDLEETTRRFHNVYEQVAKEYGYKTREDTKELDFNSPNGMTMLKTVEMITTPYLEEIERLNNIINEANKILSNILVVSDQEHKGKYRPIKNTTSQEVYKSVCMLYGILKTPYRSDYGSLQELKGNNIEFGSDKE